MRAIPLHLARLREQVQLQTELSSRLQRVLDAVRSRTHISIEEILVAINLMSVTEKYFTPAQRHQIKKRNEQVGGRSH